MKSFKLRYAFVTFELVLVSACTLPVTPSSTPTESPASPAPVSIDLAGPEMAVGSTFLYADGSLLVAVPAGMFTMGNGGLENRPENPARQVDLPDFWIYRNKVTNQQYAYCVSMGGCTAPFGPDNPGFTDYLRANDPVVGVDYIQAEAYCGFVHARLPTEAEWEKTARGPDGYIYPWADAAPSCDLLNYGICVGSTTPVNTYPAGQSYYTAFDMEGNALEWVADWYQADYYLEAPTENPLGPDKGRARSVRSSAFNSGADQTPAFTRSFSGPDTHRDNLGFRCVVEDPTYFAPFCELPATYGTDGIGGASTGGELHVSCPPLNINQHPFCQGQTPMTVVSFDSTSTSWSAGWNDDVGGSPFDTCDYNNNTSNPLDVLCIGEGGTAFICAPCSATMTFPPQCPDGYTLDEVSDSCIGQPGPGVCLPGFTQDITDTGAACCTLEPGTPAPPTVPVGPNVLLEVQRFSTCPAGTWLLTDPDGNESCITVPVQDPYCKYEPIVYTSCGPSGGDDDGCPPPPGGCPMSGEEWNSNSCSCYCPAGPGFCG